MLFRAVVLLCCAGVGLAGGRRSSPHASRLQELVAAGELHGRYSNDILEDASLDVPDLIRKYGYPVEVHSVRTPDGYLLEMHRIPHGRHSGAGGARPAVFVMHGLLSSSADWVLMGPGSGLGYILADEGFDVWMGNARGNYYSRSHSSLNPDSLFDTEFWEFSWDQIGDLDLPAMIDYTRRVSGQNRLHYIGHSQGTTAFFVMCSLRPQYNEYVISMHALAPVAYMAHNRSLFLRAIAPFSRNLESLVMFFGIGEFLPNSVIMSWAGQQLCQDEALFQDMCSNIMFLIGGWNADQHNATMLPVKIGHTPAGASVRQFAHYGQGIADGEFRRYDHGWVRNRRLYGTRTPPRYPLGRVTAPVFLHFSEQDPLAAVEDVQRLWRELGRPVGLFRVQQRTFSHLDFMWGIDARSLVYDRVINLIRSMDDDRHSVPNTFK